MSSHVIVVDDDPDVLAGMRRGLWRYRDRFTCEFVSGGREAMERLRTQSFGVALVDLEMPDIDGIALLEHLRAHHPAVVRIAFSGSCEARRCLDAMALAHRFVDKPCTTDRLVQHIEACLHDGGSGVRIAAGLKGLAEPRMLPGVYHEAVAALSDERCDTRVLAAILQRDLGATTRVLKLANSSWWSPARPITDVERAIAALGRDIVRSALLLLGLANGLSDAPAGWIDELAVHGMRVAELAAELVDDRREAGVARSAGLLHDIGRVALARSATHDYLPLLRHSDETELIAAERETFGVDHATVAGFLLELWGLPAAVAHAVARHHEQASAVEVVDAPQAVRLAEIVASHGAEALATRAGCTRPTLVRVTARALEITSRRGEGATGT
ncbi:MAG TPA: HDOD domain-containing protein [Nannocystaceae bacterium]|nr:HDOD domain-containing protein [Nannocystaceae bacterium]